MCALWHTWHRLVGRYPQTNLKNKLGAQLLSQDLETFDQVRVCGCADVIVVLACCAFAWRWVELMCSGFLSLRMMVHYTTVMVRRGGTYMLQARENRQKTRDMETSPQHLLQSFPLRKFVELPRSLLSVVRSLACPLVFAVAVADSGVRAMVW